MTDEEINKRIYKLLELCWHEETLTKVLDQNHIVCDKCANCNEETISNSQPLYWRMDFTTSWECFGLICECMQKMKELDIHRYINKCEEGLFIWSDRQGSFGLPVTLLSPRALAEAIVEF